MGVEYRMICVRLGECDKFGKSKKIYMIWRETAALFWMMRTWPMKAVSYWFIRKVALDLINFPVAHWFPFLAAWLPDRVTFATPSLFWVENNEKHLSCFFPALRVNLTRWRWHRKTRERDDRISLTLFTSPRVICIMPLLMNSFLSLNYPVSWIAYHDVYLGGLSQLSDYLLPIVKIQDASSHSVIQRRHLRWLGSLLDTGNGDMKMTRSLL